MCLAEIAYKVAWAVLSLSSVCFLDGVSPTSFAFLPLSLVEVLSLVANA